MEHFLDSVDTIAPGLGFQHFDALHFSWLALFVIVVVANCIWYKKLGQEGRDRWKKGVAIILLAAEAVKISLHLIAGNFIWDNLPLHLCGINIFLIAIHAWKPSKMLSNFLYTVCIPGAMAALLFPSWTKLPLLNFFHIHSSIAHILLVLYPFVLTAAGELKPSVKQMPKCLGLLALMAIPIYGLNILLDANFMFLMYAESNNPLYWFEQNWGSHLLGFPVIIAGVMLVMYLPMELYRKLKKETPKIS